MKTLLKLMSVLFVLTSYAQDNLTYQTPPKQIADLADVTLAPSVLIDSKGDQMILIFRDQFKSIAELSEEELRLAGLRINPVTNIGSRTRFYNNLKVKKTTDKVATQVKGLPQNPRLSYFSWSPDETKMAFLNTTDKGVEVWVLDVLTRTASKISEANINANMRSTINWFKDSKNLLVKMLSSNKKPLIDTATAVPTGPTVSVSDGSKAQNRTYQDLLKTPNDEFNFEQLALSEIKKISLTGQVSDFLPADMYDDINFSPDGNYVMVSKIKRPFSYLVTYSRFPSESNVYKSDGSFVKMVNDVPLDEVRPQGFMATRSGKRSMK